MLRVLRAVDLPRLAGIKRMLGVDLNEQRVRIIELERTGSPLNKFKPSFRVVAHCSALFEPDESDDSRGEKLRMLLAEKGIVTQQAVASMQSLAVKSVVAPIPSDVVETDDWISENIDQLLKLPIPREQLTYRYEILGRSERETLVRVVFGRKRDQDRIQRLLQKAGLKLIALSDGVSDARHILLTDVNYLTKEFLRFVYVADESVSVFKIRGGGLETLEVNPISPISDTVRRDIIKKVEAEGGEILAAGEDVETLLAEFQIHVVRPFGLMPEYGLATGLAMKGFLPELNQIDFLSDLERIGTENRIYRSLTQRCAIAFGLLVLILLLGQMVFDVYVQSRSNTIDERLLSSGGDFVEVSRLEEEVASLEKRLQGDEASIRRSNYSQILHSIAQAIPDNLWLSKISVLDIRPRKANLLFAGYSTSSEQVASFLRNLRSRADCSEVLLLRSGVPTRTDPVLPVQLASSAVFFEISAVTP